MQPSNNARIQSATTYLPVTNIVCVDEDQQIWKGDRVIEPGTPSDQYTIIYFSRKYDPENNDWDKINPEYEFTDEDIIGFKFLLIPKEKMLFGYDPPGTIIKPIITDRKGPRLSV